MSKQKRRKLLSELKAERRKFKRFFHGKKAAHFLIFRKGESGEAHFCALSSKFDDQIMRANADGHGICMAINGSPGGRRTKANFNKVNAVFIDKDAGSLTVADLKALLVPPHMIVRSSPMKLHAYWLVEGLDVESFGRVQRALAARFGTDASVSDIGRVMRMPGTLNPKYPDAKPVKFAHIDEAAVPLEVQAIVKGLGLELEEVAPTHDDAREGKREAAQAVQDPARSYADPALSKRIDEALAGLASDDRNTWLRVGMALHSHDSSEAGFALWDAWSSRSPKYDAQDQRTIWAGFKHAGAVTLGSLFYLARLEKDASQTGPKESLDEYSLAERFCELNRDSLRFDPKINAWFGFDGTIWAPGAHLPQMAARQMVSMIGDARAGALAEGLRTFRNAAGLKAIANHAQLLTQMHISSAEFDQTPNLLAVGHGVVELDTGRWRHATADDKLARRAPVAFVPQAPCALWDRFIRELVRNDRQYALFLQRALGYALFGHAKEQVFFLVLGTGGNGKGVLMRTVKEVLGQYGHSIAPNVVTRAYSGNPNAPSPALALLRGPRFVICTEFSRRTGLDEAFIKQFTGGDDLSARQNYGNLEVFKTHGKLWFSTNTMPEIEAGDMAMWRRLVPLPFKARFEGNKADPDLETKLVAEYPGILQWLIRGAVAYARDGLGTCDVVERFRKTLTANADSVEVWIEECCGRREDARLAASVAYTSYVRFARQAKRTPMTVKEFAARLERKGFARVRRNEGNFYQGLRLADGATDS